MKDKIIGHLVNPLTNERYEYDEGYRLWKRKLDKLTPPHE